MKLRLNVELSPAEVRAYEWSRRGEGAVGSVPAVGNIRTGEIRDYMQRRLNTEVARMVNRYLDALAAEQGEQA